MKKIYLISILLCYAFNAYSQSNYSGDWGWDVKTANFSISIIQKDNIIKGTHCAIAQNGNRIDCDVAYLDNNKSIFGIVKGDSVLVTFISAYCGKPGTAVIKRINATQIQWRITKQTDGISFIPGNVIMTLESEMRSGSEK
jgi:hypothetical protein